MTETDAKALAAKRELHKSKHMTHKRWVARHDPVKGWHAALVDNNSAIAAEAAAEANKALRRGDLTGYLNHGTKAVIAGVMAGLDPNAP